MKILTDAYEYVTARRRDLSIGHERSFGNGQMASEFWSFVFDVLLFIAVAVWYGVKAAIRAFR